MNTFLVILSLYLAFVTLKSWNDSIYVKRDKVIPTHMLEWGMVALMALACGIAYSNHFWKMAVFIFLLLPITWIYMDFMLNWFIVGIKLSLTHIGGGWWDDWFKDQFGNKALTAMWSAKVILLIVGIGLFILITH